MQGSYNGVLAHIEKKYALPELHVNFAGREKAAPLTGVVIADGLRDFLEGKSYYAVGMVFSVIESFIYYSLGLEKPFQLI